MARKRKRPTWTMRNFQYAVKQAEIPQAMWDQAKKMQALWNALCEDHAEVRGTISETTPEEERKGKWDAFNVRCIARVKSSGLNWECGPDVLDRFVKACIAKARDPVSSKGWPRPRGLTVSIPHAFTGGGIEVKGLSSARSRRLQLHSSCLQKAGRKDVTGVYGIDEGEIPFTIHMHRPLPEVCFVKMARWVGRYSAAMGWSWWLTICIEEPPVPRTQMTGLSVAIDVGWRKLENALRYGYMLDSTGWGQALQLSLDYSTRDTRRHRARRPEWEPIPQNHVELWNLQSDRDLELEKCKAAVKERMETQPVGFEKMRRGGLKKLFRTFTEELNNLEPEVELTDEQRAEKERVCEIIKTWLDADMPRFRRQTRASDRFAGRRADMYQKMAVSIAKKYDTICVERLEVKEMAEEEDKDPALKAADRYRQIAAPGEFLQRLQIAARKYGAVLIQKETQYTTATCHICGEQTPVGPSLHLTCPNGHTWDQDENAARNLLKSDWAAAKPKVKRTRKPKAAPALTEEASHDNAV